MRFREIVFSVMCISSVGVPLFSMEEQVSLRVEQDFTRAAKKAIPAVVSIAAESEQDPEMKDLYEFFQDDFWRHFFGVPEQRNGRGRREKVQAMGSGFVISREGLVITNNHVVENAATIRVSFSDGEELEAELVGRDPNSDIAVLQIKANSGKEFPFLEMANSDTIEVGQWAIAVGNPLGLQASLTVGVVSAKSRANLDLLRIEDFIQTDAAINRGNSGGPLLNIQGQVIGMNTALASHTGGYMGIGFAIPSNLIKTIMEQIVAKGSFTRGYIGVFFQPVDRNLAEAFGLDKAEGSLVAEVAPNSPAEKAGLRQGDIILEVDGKKVEHTGQLRSFIALLAPGSKAKLLVLRSGKKIDVTIEIAAFPEDSSSKKGGKEESSKANPLGLKVESLDDNLRAQYNLSPGDTGVLIVYVEPNSPAAFAGIKKGALLQSVNQEPVQSAEEALKKMENSQEKGVLLLIKQAGVARYLFLKIG